MDNQILKKLNEFNRENPELRHEAMDFAALAFDEIEQGGSEQHEYELFCGSLEDLKNENN